MGGLPLGLAPPQNGAMGNRHRKDDIRAFLEQARRDAIVTGPSPSPELSNMTMRSLHIFSAPFTHRWDAIMILAPESLSREPERVRATFLIFAESATE